MAGSMKDALEKLGLVKPEPPKPKPSMKEWLQELPEADAKPHVPFEAPALTKPKPSRR